MSDILKRISIAIGLRGKNLPLPFHSLGQGKKMVREDFWRKKDYDNYRIKS